MSESSSQFFADMEYLVKHCGFNVNIVEGITEDKRGRWPGGSVGEYMVFVYYGDRDTLTGAGTLAEATASVAAQMRALEAEQEELAQETGI